jgi:hypothetical protein
MTSHNIRSRTRIRFGLKSLRKHTKIHKKKARVRENQRCRRNFEENISRKYTRNRAAVTNQKRQHKPPITNYASNHCANAHLVVVATSGNEFNLADWRDTCSLDAPTPHKFLTTFRPFLAMFIRTALKARKIIKYGNATFPENEAIDYLKHSASSFLSFPPFVFLRPLYFILVFLLIFLALSWPIRRRHAYTDFKIFFPV